MNCIGHFLLTFVLTAVLRDPTQSASLPPLSVATNLCPGDTMTLPWKYRAVSGDVTEIAWNYTEIGPGKVPVPIATRSLDTGVRYFYGTKFKDRLSLLDDQTSNAGIQVRSAIESDEGTFSVTVYLRYEDALIDSVRVSFKGYMKNQVSASQKTQCVMALSTVNLVWTVVGGSVSYQCSIPSSANWTKDEEHLATYIAPSSFTVEQSEFDGRLTNPKPFVLRINRLNVSDKGDYAVDAVFQQKHTVHSDASKLQVKTPSGILPLDSMEVCIRNKVTLSWQFRRGTSCTGKPTTMDIVTWQDNENQKIAQRDAKGFRPYRAGVMEGRVSDPDDPLQYVEIVDTAVKNFGRGSYTVTVGFNDEGGTREEVYGRVNMTTEERAKPNLYSDRPPSYIEKCVGETLYLNWEYYFPPQAICKPVNASVIRLLRQSIPVYDSSKDDPSLGNKFIRRYPETNVGFVVYQLDASAEGSYGLSVDFPDGVQLVSDAVVVKVFQNPELTEPTTNFSCSDDMYHADWHLIGSQCPNPVKIKWYITTYADKKQHLVGSRATLDAQPVIEPRFQGHVQRGQSKVDIQFHDLWKVVPGDFPKKLQVQAKLFYLSAPGDNLASEVKTDVLIQDAYSDMCTGKGLVGAKFYVTRDGVDVSKDSNETVSIDDELKLTVTIPSSESVPKPRFFWQETQHNELRHYFLNKCKSPTECQMTWKMTKRSTPISFFPGEQRKLISVGVNIAFMSTKSVIFKHDIFIDNPIDLKNSTEASKKSKGERWTVQQRKGLLLTPSMSALATLIGCRFW